MLKHNSIALQKGAGEWQTRKLAAGVSTHISQIKNVRKKNRCFRMMVGNVVFCVSLWKSKFAQSARRQHTHETVLNIHWYANPNRIFTSYSTDFNHITEHFLYTSYSSKKKHLCKHFNVDDASESFGLSVYRFQRNLALRSYQKSKQT